MTAPELADLLDVITAKTPGLQAVGIQGIEIDPSGGIKFAIAPLGAGEEVEQEVDEIPPVLDDPHTFGSHRYVPGRRKGEH